MKIICATNMPYALEAFGTLGETTILEGRSIAARDVRDADILALRSTTRVNRELLEGSSVKFVGTATIGIDHLDTAYLDRVGIRWCFAPGCNANSVSEYVTAALLCLANRHRFVLEGKTLGVIGVGNVGRRVAGKAEALGMRVLKNDPPRQREEAGKTPDVFVSLEQILAEADVVTLHVPLTREGPDATYGMANGAFFARLKRGGLFFNCARGGAMETDAVLAALGDGTISHAVIDTWEDEPAYRTDLLGRVDLGTPHIAGHSFEGKVYGTYIVYKEVCRFLGVKPTWAPEGMFPPPPMPEAVVEANGLSDEEALWRLARKVYDIEADDRRFRETAAPDVKTRAAHFDRLRKDYPMRREFRFTRARVQDGRDALVRKIKGLGFAVE